MRTLRIFVALLLTACFGTDTGGTDTGADTGTDTDADTGDGRHITVTDGHFDSMYP